MRRHENENGVEFIRDFEDPTNRYNICRSDNVINKLT